MPDAGVHSTGEKHLFLPLKTSSNLVPCIIFLKRKKKDFIESVENIAELFVEFFVEKLREKNIMITTRPLARIVVGHQFQF